MLLSSLAYHFLISKESAMSTWHVFTIYEIGRIKENNVNQKYGRKIARLKRLFNC